jgi:hypothetical protein
MRKASHPTTRPLTPEEIESMRRSKFVPVWGLRFVTLGFGLGTVFYFVDVAVRETDGGWITWLGYVLAWETLALAFMLLIYPVALFLRRGIRADLAGGFAATVTGEAETSKGWGVHYVCVAGTDIKIERDVFDQLRALPEGVVVTVDFLPRSRFAVRVERPSLQGRQVQLRPLSAQEIRYVRRKVLLSLWGSFLLMTITMPFLGLFDSSSSDSGFWIAGLVVWAICILPVGLWFLIPVHLDLAGGSAELRTGKIRIGFSFSRVSTIPFIEVAGRELRIVEKAQLKSIPDGKRGTVHFLPRSHWVLKIEPELK